MYYINKVVGDKYLIRDTYTDFERESTLEEINWVREQGFEVYGVSTKGKVRTFKDAEAVCQDIMARYKLSSSDCSLSLQNIKIAGVATPAIVFKGFENDYCDEVAKVPMYVTSVQDASFKGNTFIKSISFPSTVLRIGGCVFGECCNLNNVELPSVVDLGDFCFKVCVSLKSVVLPNVKRLDAYCFYNCTSLRDIFLSKSLIEIGTSCFSFCTSLRSITIPENVAKLPKLCFDGCSTLSEVILPEKLASIGDYCFRCCESLSSLSLPDGLQEIGQYCFVGASQLEELVIPVGMKVFYLSSLIGSSVRHIIIQREGTKVCFDTEIGVLELRKITLQKGANMANSFYKLDRVLHKCFEITPLDFKLNNITLECV